MSTINSYKSFSAEIGHLATDIDHATSGKAVEKATNALFDRLRTNVPVTREQGLACTAKLNALKSRIESANDEIEARCWKKMGLIKRFFSTILWVALSVTKEGYRASQPINTKKLLDRINDAEGRFKITAAQIKKSAPKSLPAPAALQVAGKTIVVQFQAAAEAPPKAPLRPRDVILELMAQIPKKNRTPVDLIKQAFLEKMIEQHVGKQGKFSPDDVRASLLRHLNSIEQQRNECLQNIELIQAKLNEIPEKHPTTLQKVQRRFLELQLQDQKDIIDSLASVNSEGLKITKAPQEMKALLATNLKTIETRLQELAHAERLLSQFDPASYVDKILHHRFMGRFADVHATLKALLEAKKSDLMDERNVRMLPMQESAEALRGYCITLGGILTGIEKDPNMRARLQQMQDLQTELGQL